jgi:hypothetical protein
MVKILIDLTTENDLKVNIFKATNGLNTKADAINILLSRIKTN